MLRTCNGCWGPKEKERKDAVIWIDPVDTGRHQWTGALVSTGTRRTMENEYRCTYPYVLVLDKSTAEASRKTGPGSTTHTRPVAKSSAH